MLLPTRRTVGTRLTAVALALRLYQMFALPLLLLPGDPWSGWTLLPLALLTTPFWSLIHEPESVAGPLLERLAQPKVLRQFRIDAAAIAVLHGLAFAAYGAHWWMLALALGGRALIVSLSDNAYHYGTDLDQPLVALNLRLPPALELFALGFNLHGLHHRRPGLRWYELRPAFDAEGGECDAGWFRAVGRQLRGPIALPDRSPSHE
ncbi:fatty acid desaturase [Nocardia sp. NPDC057353]|uniref:fatty acid desaturase n=1 Tax=Nocardia sp. NPDC057353 TaxID=3346104 RepID=UPI0036452EEB